MGFCEWVQKKIWIDLEQFVRIKIFVLVYKRLLKNASMREFENSLFLFVLLDYLMKNIHPCSKFSI